jgi:amino acid adenylation domain-containing protein
MDKQKNIEDIYPLSPMQQGILFHTLLAPDAGAYVPQVCFTLNGLTDVNAFQRAWQQVLIRHPILRTAFRWERRDEAFQVVYRTVDLPWEEQDWQEFSTAEQQKKLVDFLKCDTRSRSFDFKTPPLFRITLIQLAKTRYQLIWTQHHIILDGWSAGLVLKEVFDLYQAFNNQNNSEFGISPAQTLLQRNSDDGTNLPIYQRRPYSDYIAWLRQQDLSTAQAFWQKQLKGFTTPNFLQIEQRLPTSSLPSWYEQQIALPVNITTALKSLAQQHQLTLNTLIQGAFAILLSRYCNEDDIVFGATSSGRPATLTGSEAMIGLFINTLPVRVQVSPRDDLIPWLQQLQAQQAEALQYEYTPLLDIQAWSEIPRGAALFECILVFENYPVDTSLLQSQAGLSIEAVRAVEWTSFPITVLVSAAAELTLKVKCDRHRFDDLTITRLLAHLQMILKSIAINPQQRLGELPLLTDAEQQLLAEWNSTQAEYPTHQCLHELFEAQVERTPDAIAVVFEEQQLTYRELNARANQLAHYLQTLGVGAEVLVGICIERSIEMIIGILAILKAGGAYIPLDPAYPQERLAFMLEDAQVSVLIWNSEVEEWKAEFGRRNLEGGKRNSEIEETNSEFLTLINLDTAWETFASFPQSNPRNRTTPDNSIYVIYTSGSTGKPKGVINTHRGLVNRLCWMQKTYQLQASERVLQKTTFSFDVSVWEFFWTLLSGACIIVAQSGGHQDSAYLAQLIQEQQITTLHFVPSMLQVFLEEPGLDSCRSLQRVICSGEALTIDLQNRFFARLDAQLHNLYGPTEAAIDVTYFECGIQNAECGQNTLNPILNYSVPIGRPIDNTQIYILDAHQRQVPIGVAGELYIAGDGLARGYLNQPDLTAEKFIPNPFWKSEVGSRNLELGSRKSETMVLNSEFLIANSKSEQSLNSQFRILYKTGDRARYLSDGNIEFLGRIDYQVKLRGFRIELGEIESVLSKHPNVLTAVVIAKEYQPGDQRLVAYIVPTPNSELQTLNSELRSFLQTKLPAYMQPFAFIMLESLPLTPNGKLDRRVLARDRTESASPHVYVPPSNSTETVIAAIWTEVLKLERVGRDDNFFDLGGNSLFATRINSRLRQAFQLDLPLRSLFEKPTIAALAEHIQTLQMTIQQLQNPVGTSTGRKEISL